MFHSLCINGFCYQTVVELDLLHRCNDFKYRISLQKHLFEERNDITRSRDKQVQCRVSTILRGIVPWFIWKYWSKTQSDFEYRTYWFFSIVVPPSEFSQTGLDSTYVYTWMSITDPLFYISPAISCKLIYVHPVELWCWCIRRHNHRYLNAEIAQDYPFSVESSQMVQCGSGLNMAYTS